MATAERTGPRVELLTDADVEGFPDPSWLVAGVLPQPGLATLYGPPGDGKTFFMLSLAFSVATGRPFLGLEVRRGPVVYVLGEGLGGLKHRLRALKTMNRHHGPAGLHFVRSPVQLHEPLHVHGLCNAVAATLTRVPALIVFDTLARSMVGGDENSARDVGEAIAGADYVREQFGATVVLVHHSQKAGELERGSSALRAAADTMLSLKADDGLLTLEVTKQKDGPLVEPLRCALEPVEGSCVLVTAEGRSTEHSPLSRKCHQLLEALEAVAINGTASAQVWLESSASPKRTFYRLVKRLVDGGYVVKRKGAGYELTAAGQAALVPSATRVPLECHGTAGAKVPPVHTPFRGGTNGTGTSRGLLRGDAYEGPEAVEIG
jgi:KaiC/GvpD/RAD55 family RecA-like ATPase